jgi:carbonic anhydrase
VIQSAFGWQALDLKRLLEEETEHYQYQGSLACHLDSGASKILVLSSQH